MNIQIIVGSVREGRTAIKIAHWIKQQIQTYYIFYPLDHETHDNSLYIYKNFYK